MTSSNQQPEAEDFFNGEYKPGVDGFAAKSGEIQKLIDRMKSFGIFPDEEHVKQLAELSGLKDNQKNEVTANELGGLKRRVKAYANRKLNTYPNLVKDNLAAFFPGGTPEDALDDYEETKHDPYYIDIDDLDDFTMEDLDAVKKENAESILKDRLEHNRMVEERNKKYTRLDGTFDVSKAMGDIFGSGNF